jgi:hypothetical protein
MVLFQTLDGTNISLSTDDLNKHPNSLLSILYNWDNEQSITLDNLTSDNLILLYKIYKDIPVPDFNVYSNKHMYEFYSDSLGSVNLLDYYMLSYQDLRLESSSQDQFGDSETSASFTDDFVANWESEQSEEEDTVSDWSDDEGIWE